MPRDCIFCAQKANSNEDAIPLWLSEMFRGPGTMEHQPGIDKPTRTYAVTQPKMPIKRVCKKCNNGWMSRLESRAKPIIMRLLEATPARKCTLDIHECRTLALWSAKTAMVHEAVNPPENWAFSELDRCLIYTKDQVPGSTDVWLAPCANFASTFGISRILSNEGSPDRVGITTLCYGCLAIQIRKMSVSTTIPGAKVTIGEQPGPWPEVLLAIWPPAASSFCWPTEKGLDGEKGLEALANRFSGPVPDPAESVAYTGQFTNEA